MTDKQVSEILFDSEIHKWNKNDSEFVEKLNEKRNIIVLIEDERQNLFGGYIGNQIHINKNVKDNSCFVSSMRKNGEYQMKRYLKNEIGYSYGIANDSQNVLITFGNGNDNLCRDIVLYKKDYSYGSCQQECYNYNGESFALTGKYWFNIKRIVVYQLQ